MDKERKKRLKTWKIILTDVLIVAAVIALVVVLSFIAMGYKLDDKGNLDQSGLLQAESTPTGATVIIDGETMFSRTNMSRLLSEGKHQVRLEKEGYELWENSVEIKSGKLYKLDYPQLFKQDRKSEIVATGAEAAEILKKEIAASSLSDNSVVTKSSTGSANILAVTTKYLGARLIGTAIDDEVRIFDGDDEGKIVSSKVGFSPSEAYILANGRLMIFSLDMETGKRFAVFDAEQGKIFNFEVEGTSVFWLNNYLIGNITEAGDLYVRDFDGTNRRKLAEKVTIKTMATISQDNKWLYYLVDDGTRLKREEL